MVKTRSEKSVSAAPRGKEAIASYNRKLTIGQTVAAVVILTGLWWIWDNQLVGRLGVNKVHIHSMADRITFTLRHQVPSVAVLVASLLHVSVLRFTNAKEHQIELVNRILVNTFEQYLLTLVNQLVLASHIPESHLKVIPLITISFVLGRILFAAGYLRNPTYRSLGFSITFLPTLAILCYNIYFTWVSGYSHHLGAGVSGGRA